MSGPRILVVVGTRPEAIKLAPVILELRAAGLAVRVCATAQHRDLLDPVLAVFGVVPDFDLDVMRPGQDLYDLTAHVLRGMKDVLREARPALVLVQGDTTTALAAALAAFYEKVPVAHVEAGLRTGRRWSPFPEEMNRKLVTRLAGVHYAPTARARRNLLDEGVEDRAIVVTGNPVLDALLLVAEREFDLEGHLEGLGRGLGSAVDGRPLILLTAHRRESFGERMRAAFEAVGTLRDHLPDHAVVYPVHPNPNVRTMAREVLGRRAGVHLIPPLDYVPFVHLMKRSRIILTDSGGIQEEAPSLGKPVLVLREDTERPEATEAGTALLVGHDPARIVAEAERLLTDAAAYDRMVGRENPFGDGRAAGRIVRHVRRLIA